MTEAMKAVTEKKMTIRGAAKKFGVPYSTLKDRVHGRVQHGTKPGVKTALSPEEEEELVKYIKVRCRQYLHDVIFTSRAAKFPKIYQKTPGNLPPLPSPSQKSTSGLPPRNRIKKIKYYVNLAELQLGPCDICDFTLQNEVEAITIYII